MSIKYIHFKTATELVVSVPDVFIHLKTKTNLSTPTTVCYTFYPYTVTISFLITMLNNLGLAKRNEV